MDKDKEKIRYRFFIDKRGNWFQDGIKIQHRLTYLYNNKLLDRDERGRYYVDEGSGKLYVEVEDTPFVVKMVSKRGEGIYLSLNDGTEERLDFGNFYINTENIPYTRVKNGRFEARFLRPAYYELMKYAKKDGGEYFIELGDSKNYFRRK